MSESVPITDLRVLFPERQTPPAAPPGQPPANTGLHWRTVDEYFPWMIGRWEIYTNREGRLVTYQNVAADAGNYNSRGERVGTNYGVSAPAYEEWIGRPPTVEDMKAITIEIAGEIGKRNYYERPGFNRIPWCPALEVIVDWGWGSGPAYSTRQMQAILGVGQDGIIGPITQHAFAVFVGHRHDEMAAATDTFARARRDHWYRISAPGSRNAQFRTIWLERADAFFSSNWPADFRIQEGE